MSCNENTVNCKGCIYFTSNNFHNTAKLKNHVCVLGKFKINCKQKATHESTKTVKVFIKRRMLIDE